MAIPVELTTLDLRFQDYRMRDDAREARLLASIAQRGVEEPLEGVDLPADEVTFTSDSPAEDANSAAAADRPPSTRWRRVLLNGFQRYRCARKLKIHEVPYVSLGHDEAAGILQLLRVAKDQKLGILEQARFIDELMTIHGQSLTEVAESLSRSKGWVSMRCGLLAEITPTVRAILFRGTFPVYSYLYSLRPFRRMNGVTSKLIERFVRASAGQKLSVRDIDWLAQAYFKGPSSLRQAIDDGKARWSLEQMKQVPADPEGCNEFERQLLRDLEQLRKLQRRVLAQCDDARLIHRAFLAEAHVLAAGLLCECDSFFQQLRSFYDRIGQAKCDVPDASGGDVVAGD
jgi:hypothetical protein